MSEPTSVVMRCRALVLQTQSSATSCFDAVDVFLLPLNDQCNGAPTSSCWWTVYLCRTGLFSNIKHNWWPSNQHRVKDSPRLNVCSDEWTHALCQSNKAQRDKRLWRWIIVPELQTFVYVRYFCQCHIISLCTASPECTCCWGGTWWSQRRLTILYLNYTVPALVDVPFSIQPGTCGSFWFLLWPRSKQVELMLTCDVHRLLLSDWELKREGRPNTSAIPRTQESIRVHKSMW